MVRITSHYLLLGNMFVGFPNALSKLIPESRDVDSFLRHFFLCRLRVLDMEFHSSFCLRHMDLASGMVPSW